MLHIDVELACSRTTLVNVEYVKDITGKQLKKAQI